MSTDNITRNDLLKAITEAGSNPAAILQTTLTAVEEAYNGSLSFVDATNPIVTEFEAAAVTHAASIQQHTAALRRVYPTLAQTPEDLYHHMSYRDYLNRFASPSTDPFYLFVPLNQFFSRMVPVEDTNYSKVTLPRGMTITVNKYVTFTLQYPIDIRYYQTQSLEVAYDASVESPLQQLTTNVIIPEIISEPGGQERWIRFEIPVPQIKVKKVTDNIQAGRYFVARYQFDDQFVMARAYFRNSGTGQWVEMLTTHSPTVYSPTSPTMQLKVINNELAVSLPLVYQSTGQVSGEVRVDIYTSKGSEVIKLEDYALDAFVLNFDTLDPERDTTKYSVAANQLSIQCRSTSIVSGGKDALTFEQLLARVINNSLGPQTTPITNINIRSAAENSGFDLVPNVDTVTNRIFYAIRRLPAPTNSKLVTSANIGISTYITDDPSTINHPWVKVHGKRATFLSSNLYRSNSGVLELLSKPEVEALKLMDATNKLTAVNSTQYLYSPFYYVVDTSSLELKVRTYHLDQPEALGLNFVSQNTSLQLIVNTDAYTLYKVDSGYKLQIRTKSGSHYKKLADNEVACQLAVKLQGSVRQAYWLGQLVGKTDDGERIFEFDLQTDYDINANDSLALINGKIDASSETPVDVDLISTMRILHTTSSLTPLYVQSEMDEMLGRFQLPPGSAAVTLENIQLKFGVSLDGIWNRARTVPDTDIYERYAIDVPMVYEEDVFDEPPFVIQNGKVVYKYLFRKGDPVLDTNGAPRYLHRKGDIVMRGGEPVISSTRIGAREFDMLMVDGRQYFVTDPSYLEYNAEFTNVIVGWVTEEIARLRDQALENTEIYFYPKNQLTSATLLVADYTEERVESGQSLVVDVYVIDDVIRDSERAQRLKTAAVQYLDKWISSTRISVSEGVAGLSDIFGDTAYSIKLSGLGGRKDYQLVTIAHEEDRLSLKRVLDIQQDGTFIMREDVTINFLKGTPVPVS